MIIIIFLVFRLGVVTLRMEGVTNRSYTYPMVICDSNGLSTDRSVNARMIHSYGH